MNLILNIFKTVWDNFTLRIQMPAIIAALAFTILGVVCSIMGARVARVVRKSNHIEDNDSVLITFKVIALVCLFVAILLVVFRLFLELQRKKYE